jgi:hypothetical protein
VITNSNSNSDFIDFASAQQLGFSNISSVFMHYPLEEIRNNFCLCIRQYTYIQIDILIDPILDTKQRQ